MEHGFTSFTSAFPKRCIRSDEHPFCRWERQCRRAGVERRHIAREESIQQLAIDAMRKLLAKIGLAGHPPCTALVLATTGYCSDSRPSVDDVAEEVGNAFGITATAGVNYACSGFAAAVSRALRLRERHDHVAVVCSEAPSRNIDFDDSATAVIFGDGAGATSVSATGEHPIAAAWATAFSDARHSIGKKMGTFANIDGQRVAREVFRMEGDRVAEIALEHMTELVAEEMRSIPEGSRTAVVPHQPSGPIIRFLEHRLEQRGMHLPVYSNLTNRGNLASASVPVALADLLDTIEPDTIVLCPTFGGGPDLQDGMLSKGMVRFVRK